MAPPRAHSRRARDRRAAVGLRRLRDRRRQGRRRFGARSRRLGRRVTRLLRSGLLYPEPPEVRSVATYRSTAWTRAADGTCHDPSRIGSPSNVGKSPPRVGAAPPERVDEEPAITSHISCIDQGTLALVVA